MAWTIERFTKHFDCNEQIAERCIGLLRGTHDYRDHPAVVEWAERCYHDPRLSIPAKPECIMKAFDAELKGCGVEAIEGRYVDRYHQNIQATYINFGDTYDATIVYDNEQGRYTLTTLGDWIEQHHNRQIR